ncbi:MAG: class I SAM-dependent methyltransferase [Firmicutes bacterium]|nr:class I SAM-dependent methyltransferase [Bacillota bacterium]
MILFYTSISSYYEYIFPLKREKVKFALDGLASNENILDVGCSTGKLARAISEYGHSVIGIDLDKDMISIAKEYENDKLSFYKMNMLDIDKNFSESIFDEILCFGNTLVHLQNNKDVLNLFKKIRLLLKEGGKFKFQVINYEKVLNENLNGLPTIENEKVKFIREYKLINGLIEFKTKLIIKDENKVIKNKIMLLPIGKDEILKLLKEAGFKKINCFSSFSKESFDKSKLPLVIEAS